MTNQNNDGSFMRIIKMFILELLALPLWIAYKMAKPDVKQLIDADVMEMNTRTHQNHKTVLFWLASRKEYRNVFYVRLPRTRYYRLLLPRYAAFSISAKQGIGGGIFVLNHPFSTIINAKRIGKNFTVCQLTTVGNAIHSRNDLVPSIGDNVMLGANVTIIGDITIGNNVIVGAGSVVVKDVPDNCIIAGNPARVIRYTSENNDNN